MRECKAIFKRGEQAFHFENQCQEVGMPCSKCEMFVKLKEIGGHDCIKDMRRSIEAQALQITTLTKFVFTLASNFNTAVDNSQRIDLGDLINKLSIIGVSSIPPLPKVYSIIF